MPTRLNQLNRILTDIDRELAEAEVEMLRPLEDHKLRGQLELQTSLQLLRQQVERKLRESEQVNSVAKELTCRELEVFTLIAGGLTTQQIAERLQLGMSTVETYRDRLKQKLELKTGNELNRAAILWAQRRDNQAGSESAGKQPGQFVGR